MNIPKITARQRDILDLLYKYRFLNRIQIQALLGHKDYKTINLWLRDLREKDYVEWIYSTHFAEKTKPAVYYLGINAIRHFRQNDIHPDEFVRKYYREAGRSRAFVARCILLADACIAFQQYNDTDGDDWYYYETEAEYTEKGFFHFLVDTDIHPHLCHSKMTKDEDGEDKTVTSYTVEAFEPTLPRHSVRRRLKNYVQFLDGEAWQSETNEDKLPIALFICPTKADMIYCKRATKRLLNDAWDAEKIHMRFTMIESVKKQGFRARIWEEVMPPVEDD